MAVGGNDHRVAVWCLDRITTDDSELTEEIRMEQSRSVLHKHSVSFAEAIIFVKRPSYVLEQPVGLQFCGQFVPRKK